MQVHGNVYFKTLNTDRTWFIQLFSPDESAPETTGEPALWRYVIYDENEDHIIETDFYSKRREDTLAFACGRIAMIEDQAGENNNNIISITNITNS